MNYYSCTFVRNNITNTNDDILTEQRSTGWEALPLQRSSFSLFPPRLDFSAFLRE